MMDKKLESFNVLSNSDSSIFWDKLKSEYGWSTSYAREAFAEYKKFVWLAKISQSRVVPSKVVDKVWHLHMTFTKSYWHDLCRDILGFELHHIPSPISKANRLLDKSGYKNTLTMYKAEFGREPSSRFWPKPVKNKVNFLKISSLILFSVTSLSACSLTSSDNLKSFVIWGLLMFVLYKLIMWADDHSDCSDCSSD